MDTERERRIAENESIFRDVNESVEDTAERFLVDGQIAQEFLCECGDVSCFDRIRMTIDEYEVVRSNSRHFAIVPGHEIPEVEVVVEEHPGYSVIEKLGSGGTVADERDPRRDDAS